MRRYAEPLAVMLTIVLAPVVAMRVPSGPKTIVVTFPLCPANGRSSCPVAASQMQIDLGAPPPAVANNFPSGENTALVPLKPCRKRSVPRR